MIRFIADIGSNHNGDWPRTERLMAVAKVAGCDAIKFQLFRGKYLYAPGFSEQINEMRQRELRLAWLPDIADACHRLGLEFHCTPFDLEAVELLKPYVDAYKISSYDVLNHRLIEAVARAGKPVSLSGGNAKAAELRDAYLVARPVNHRVTVYHCSARYPAPVDTCDLHAITAMKEKYETIGWSDHTREPAVLAFAVALGASVIELHIDLDDRMGAESVHGHCWTHSEIKQAADMIKAALPALRKPSVVDDIWKWRADPEDGARPLKKYREELLNKADQPNNCDDTVQPNS